ncbi:MAG: flavodoxin-dependent (E)-4-hydroxy-3-methylbut-2-enyl-diphosphate synthase [Spirochaetes bacterium]|nr:flavodoxin-dependent (E)-4-hydroxy-3-methylbut-2-enyl-diphosphate synthase [Spirochaetota bacterium]
MKSIAVQVGSVTVGGDAPISIQTMWKRPLQKVDEGLIAEVNRLKALGCDILRFAVPDMETADLLGRLASRVSIPLVADIHFDYRLALRCLDYPIAKIRINPGNIGARWKVEQVVRKAQDKGVPIRIGVNHGSLPQKFQTLPDPAAALLAAAEEEIEILESLSFRSIIVSMKSSDTESTVEANRRFAQRYSYPLHIGITEAGPLIPGIVRSTLALSQLLKEGIGSTIRVSLSDAPETEVLTAKELLSALGLRKGGVRIISCPRCGRSGFDVQGFLKVVGEELQQDGRDLTVAVMGCVVNGPGESRHADLGITGSGDKVVIFKKGKIVHTVRPEEAVETFLKEFRSL